MIKQYQKNLNHYLGTSDDDDTWIQTEKYINALYSIPGPTWMKESIYAYLYGASIIEEDIMLQGAYCCAAYWTPVQESPQPYRRPHLSRVGVRNERKAISAERSPTPDIIEIVWRAAPKKKSS